MVAYRKIDEASPPTGRRVALSHELFHGLTPEEFNQEAQSLADAQAMTPAVRRRLEAIDAAGPKAHGPQVLVAEHAVRHQHPEVP